MPSSGRERGERKRERDRLSLSENERDGEQERNEDRKKERERNREEKPRGRKRARYERREEDGARKAGKSEDRRPKTHQESVVVAPTDGRTDGRPHKQRISSSVYSPCIVHACERTRWTAIRARRYRLSPRGGQHRRLPINSGSRSCEIAARKMQKHFYFSDAHFYQCKCS